MRSEPQIKTSIPKPPISFLDSLALDLQKRFGNNLLRVLVLMPNSRGGFYLKESFKKLASGQPMVLPKTQSLDKWVASHCPYQIVGENEAVLYLFQSFKRLKNPRENLEDFFPLGQNLYSDFEEIIRNEVSIQHVFTALERWEATGLGFADFLGDEQKQLLANFWSNFEAGNSAISQRMLDLWKAIPLVFESYESDLKRDGKCTAARAYSNFSAELPTLNFPDFDSVYFVGFGELTATERSLIRGLKAKTNVSLVWDFSESYVDSPQHEVNRLIHRLKKDFNLKESIEKSLESAQEHKLPEVELIRCQGLEGMNQWITNLARNSTKKDRTGLIVLEPALVQMIVQNSGNEDFPFNISMGFPLLSTPEAIELMGYLESWKTGVRPAANSPKEIFPASTWMREGENSGSQYPDWINARNPKDGLILLDEWLQMVILKLPKSTYDQQVWRLISSSVSELIRLFNLANEQNPTGPFVARLAKSLFSGRTLKMEGKPDQGIQVMGLYESRLLDFDHVILAPANDGFLPSSTNQKSLLPDTLRRAFGLLTRSQASEDEMYQAWRLTHRSGKISLLVAEDGESKPSRMVPQLLYSDKFSVSPLQQKFGASLPVPVFGDIEKNDFVREKLKKFSSESGLNELINFSPSSLYSLLQCQLRFYFSYVLELKKPEDGAELGMDVRDFGNWVHNSIQDTLKLWQSDRTVLQKASADDLFSIWSGQNEASWNQMKKVDPHSRLSDFFIEKEVGAVMAMRFFKYLETIKPIQWKASEVKLNRAFLTDSQDDNRKWSIEGRVDLVVELENETLLIDLKSGGFGNESDYTINPGNLDVLLNKFLKTKDLFQMMVYNWVIWKNRQVGEPDNFKPRIRAKLFYLADPRGTFVDPMKGLTNEDDIESVFNKLEEILEEALGELFDPSIPFQRTEEPAHCQYCDFIGICQR